MSDKKSTNLIVEKLFSNNTEEALFAINKIRNSKNPEILLHLIEILNSGTSNEVRKAVIDILNDLKIQTATSTIINAVKINKSQDIQKILLTSIWQSGLDYTEHLEFFVDLFISGNFEIAFEAFTIIDNMDFSINAQTVNALINKLKLSTPGIDKGKAGLLAELVHIIEHMNVG